MAIPLPEPVLDLAEAAQTALACESKIRFVRRSQLHCTLVFIGVVAQNETQAAREVVKNVSPHLGGNVWVGGLVLLPNARRARVVALGLEDPDGALARLHEVVRTGLEAQGLTSGSDRPLLPHVTIGRMRVPGPVQPTTECERLRFGLESVCLYESELRRDGAVYTRLEQVDLQRAHGQEKA